MWEVQQPYTPLANLCSPFLIDGSHKACVYSGLVLMPQGIYIYNNQKNEQKMGFTESHSFSK